MAAKPAETGLSQPSDGAYLPDSGFLPDCVCPSDNRAVSLHFMLAAEDIGYCADKLDRLSGTSAVHEQLRVIYLDTPDHAITGHGLGFGICHRDSTGKSGRWKRFVEPLSSATSKGLHHALAACLRRAAAIEVMAQAGTEQWLWSFSCDGSLAQARLERTTIVMNGKTAVLGSFRLICAAPNAAFFRFVAEICEPDRLRLNAESNLARAYRLCGGPSTPHVLAFTPNLDTKMDAGTAFRVIATACFDHFLLNETLIRATKDREAVHQCRVALRRLSACLRLFAAFIGGTDYEALRADLKGLGTYLRDARDLDVMIADVIAPALAADPPTGAKALMHEIEARREKAYTDLVAKLCAPSSAALFLRFALWLEAGDWTSSTDPKSIKRRHEPIVTYARKKFDRLNSKFGARCAELGQMDKEGRHSTRIHAKNLRYSTEFFATLARSKAAGKRMLAFIHTIKSLQTVLGDWNDILMARQFLSGFGQEAKMAVQSDVTLEVPAGTTRRTALKDPNLSIRAAKALVQHIEAMSDAEFSEKSAKACRAFNKLKPFWTQLG